jgi:hypothetical protein
MWPLLAQSIHLRDVDPWLHLWHDLFIGLFFLWLGWKLGKRQIRKEIERGHIPVEDVLPPDVAAVLMDEDE